MSIPDTVMELLAPVVANLDAELMNAGHPHHEAFMELLELREVDPDSLARDNPARPVRACQAVVTRQPSAAATAGSIAGGKAARL